MAYVPNHKYDIFVSYAHVDNEPDPYVKVGWVSALVQSLKIRLARKIEDFSLWMDPQLSKHDQITPSILDSIRETATLLVILSNGYIRSQWCQREKDNFLKNVEERPNSRIFIVEFDEVKKQDRPFEFRDYHGYRFWVRDPERLKTRTIGMPKPNPDNPEHQLYYNRLNDLAIDIAEELEKLKKAYKTTDEEDGMQTEGSLILLAEATDDLDEIRDNVKQYLDRAGISVLPDTCYPREPHSFQQALDIDLAKSKLFAQLLSEIPGKRPPGVPHGYARLQYDRAIAAKKPILQWRSPKVDLSSVQDTSHLNLLNGNTVLEVDIEQFKREIVQQVSPLSKTTFKKTAGPIIFLAEVTDDLEETRNNVKRYLDQAGINVLPDTYYSPDPQSFQQALDNDLAKCKLFVQLLSEIPGKRPPGVPHGYARLQYDRAIAAKKPILQWRSPKVDLLSVKDTSHHKLLDGNTVIVASIEQFKREIVQQVSPLPKTTRKKSADTLVFLNAVEDDRDMANRVGKFLSSYGVGYVLPMSAGAPVEIRNDLEQNLLTCDAVIIIYGNTTVRWVREQLRYYRKICPQRELPPSPITVYKTPPKPKEQIGFNLPNLQTIESPNGPEYVQFKSLLKTLSAEKNV